MEVGFIWAIWNEPIAINIWKLKVNETIDKICQMCGNGEEIIVHIFGIIVSHSGLGSMCKNF